MTWNNSDLNTLHGNSDKVLIDVRTCDLTLSQVMAEIARYQSEMPDHEIFLDGDAYDGSGLIYGIGHAVYTVSDPRAVELKRLAGELAKEKGRDKEYDFLRLLEQESIKCVSARRKTKKPLCANVDFYSGFIYEMIGLPQEIYTPIFAMSRIVGWMAHRIEELNFEGRRIIRPAYKSVMEERTYVPLAER